MYLIEYGYSAGQLVRATSTRFVDRMGGVHEVIRLMPESGEEFGFKVENMLNSVPRAVRESEIRVPDAKHGVSSPTSDHRQDP